VLLEDVLSHTDVWCVLPPATSDRLPQGVERLAGVLTFLDEAALYRVVPWISDGHLGLCTERIPFASFRQVLVSDTRHGSARERHWQFRTEGDAFNQSASEGGTSRRRPAAWLMRFRASRGLAVLTTPT
jgi:hypothetical protein